MSSDVSIRVHNLTKDYQIYEQPQDRLKQSLLPRVQRWLGQPPVQYFRHFRAVDQVSFEIHKGETVGIIGRNGSGKSTLLQLICGTLTPTEGTIETTGRLTALLELGAGFNPEFSGRENVFMNGALLGLSQTDIHDRFEEIAAFADIGDFIEQPVKTYSSGMYVRLAFALNVLCDPEIMIVDEALAVGDMKFQAKCITALRRIQARGATVLFVSHDLGTVKSLCDRGIYLERGAVRSLGKAAQVAEDFIRVMREEMNQEPGFSRPLKVMPQPDSDTATPPSEISAQIPQKQVELSRYGSGEATIQRVDFLDSAGQPIVEAEFDQEVVIRIHLVSHAQKTIAVSYYIHDDKKILLLGVGPRQLDLPFIEAGIRESYVVTFQTRVPLHEGAYSIQIQVTEPIVEGETARFLDVVDDAIVFKVDRRPGGRLWSKVFIPTTMTVEQR
jgi:lipopolysaccharide transport system ATP-binding protein